MAFTTWKLVSMIVVLTHVANKLALGANNVDEIVIESFQQPQHKWRQMNDPVMGGESTGTFSFENGNGFFEGVVADVPFLHAPGFIQAFTVDHQSYPDVSMCEAISWRVRSTSEESAAYTGFRVSFGDAHPPNGKRHAFGYKADLGIVSLGDFVDIAIPFSQFSNYWDDATGDAIISCEEDSKYCPREEDLKDLKTVAIWAEGVAGKVSVEIDSIRAVECGPDSS